MIISVEVKSNSTVIICVVAPPNATARGHATVMPSGTAMASVEEQQKRTVLVNVVDQLKQIAEEGVGFCQELDGDSIFVGGATTQVGLCSTSSRLEAQYVAVKTRHADALRQARFDRQLTPYRRPTETKCRSTTSGKTKVQTVEASLP